MDERSLKIVSKMNTYLPKYSVIRDAIKSQLATTATVDGDTFTSHGYDHCVRIFQELNNLLEGNDPFFTDVSDEELFCLAASILLHDLVMTKNPDDRKTHAAKARKLIREEFEKLKDSPLTSNIKDSVVDAIGDIVAAHSDEKDDKGNPLCNALEKVKDREYSGETGVIRVSILSALLRFGDELDCTSARLNDCQKIHKSEETKKNPHWRKLELVRQIFPPKAAHTHIKIGLNDLVLEGQDDLDNDILRIEGVLGKLQSSLTEVNNIIFLPQKVTWWHYVSVDLEDESQKLFALLRDKVGITEKKGEDPFTIPHKDEIITPSDQRNFDVSSQSFFPNISTKIKERVLKENLYKSGHFVISSSRHARDWIDTSKFLEHIPTLNEIVNTFNAILQQTNHSSDDTILIGDGFPGLIISSQLGFIGNYGCTYIKKLYHQSFSGYSLDLSSMSNGKKIVLVTDVIAMGETIEKTIDNLITNHLIAPERISQILSVFYRKSSEANKKPNKDIFQKLIYLNEDFPIQFCKQIPASCLFCENASVELINQDLTRRSKLH